MPPDDLSAETILIVDDEDSVRRTFREWLESADLGCRILAAADAESALLQANQQTIDLAILDWNLGAGSDGLQLLEDLALFNPDVVAIMITGFAHQATPLDAMRMGVRDYLDKNQDLDRATFLRAVRRQLERIRPARRERQLHHGLVAFRSAVDKVLPLVQASAAMTDPVPLPAAVQSLFRFLMRTTGAAAGALLVRGYDPGREPAEVCRVYGADGRPIEGPLAPFARSVAGGAIGLGEPNVMVQPDRAAATGAVELHPFEKGRRSLLAAPLAVAPGLQVVLELFDKQAPSSPLSPVSGERGRGEGDALDPAGFTDADRRLAAAAADFGAEMLRQALAERQTQRVLFDAVEAALGASDSVAQSLRGAAARPDEPPPQAVMERLKEGLGGSADAGVAGGETLRLAEAVRVLALRHGGAAVRHCTEMVESLRRLLDETAGVAEDRP
ncbi:MAG TPA: response regulator [Gemmataceae bacterium]|nr:response regulator [Gemmataceae bacterium]